MTGKENVFSEIRKRDGRIVPFEADKITQAIFAAARAVGGEDYALAERISSEVIRFLAACRLPGVIPGVEEIQDVVEKVLIERGHARTAKAYILYRAGRTRIREARSELMDVVQDILLDEHSEEAGDINNPADKMYRIALAASRKYYLDNLLPSEIAEAHIQGDFHIEKLGYYSKSIDSLQVELEPLLCNGFHNNKEKDLSHTLYGILLRITLILQRCHKDLYGEVAIPAFDTVLGKIIRKEGIKTDSREFAASLKDFLSYMRAFYDCSKGNDGGCSIAFGLDFSAEGMAVARTLLLDLCENQGHKTFPRFIFMLKKGINTADGEPAYALYRLALQAVLGGANLTFCLVENLPDQRTETPLPGYFSNGLYIGEKRHGIDSGIGIGRGNTFSLSLNMPRLALKSESGDEELFFVELDRLLHLAVRQLLHRFEVLTALECRDLPFIMGARLYQGSELLAPADNITEPLKKGVMTLCFCGLRETVNILSREQNNKENSKRLHKKILKHLCRRVGSFAAEYDLNIALSGTVNLDTARLLVKKDRQDFGLVKGVTDREFYNNGFLLFQEDEGLSYKMEREGELHRYCAAGYASKAVLLSCLKVDGAIDFIQRLTAAGVKLFHLAAGKDLFGT